ncbi:MAG: hypothetical protein K2Q06_01285, partial [Parvularculaceae bacterium]|nr:hypothetical protein [Parvularculaceae bacterium]
MAASLRARYEFTAALQEMRLVRNEARGALATDDEDDEALVARAGRGDRLAASALVVRHSDRVFAVCRRLLRD